MTDLHDHLDDLARATDVPAGDLDAVVRRGRRRANRARAGVGLVAVIAAITTGAVIIGGGDADETPIAAGDATNATTGDTGVTWTVAEPTSALSQMGRPAAAAGTQLYALSTAPGQAPTDRPTPLRVWSSSDGVDWSDAGEPTGDIYLSDLDATDGRLYAVGTGPATAATTASGTVPEMLIGSSDDGGASWQTGGVDIDLAGIAEHSTSMSWAQRDVATSGDAVVALVGVHAELDVRELLPEGDDAPNGWAITSTGIDVLGPAPDEPCPKGGGARTAPTAIGNEPPPARVWGYTCDDGSGGYTTTSPQDAHGVERSYTWDELGVSGDLLDATLGHPSAYVRTADGTFQRVEIPATDTEAGWSTLTGGAAGFDIIVNPADGSAPTRLHSADGVTWTQGAPLPGGLAWIATAGTLGDRTVFQGSTETNQPLAIVGDTVVNPSDVLGDAAAGHELYWAGGAVGDAGVVMIVGLAPKDPEITEYDSDDIQLVAMWSRDGTTWEYRTLDELAGQHVGTVTSAAVTADRFVVTTAVGERDAQGHLRQLALVGSI
jgi:hypothetical protein